MNTQIIISFVKILMTTSSTTALVPPFNASYRADVPCYSDLLKMHK